MDKKIQVLGLEIDHVSAKDALKRVTTDIETEPVSIIEMITMHTLDVFQQYEGAEELLGNIDLALAGDKTILEAVGIQEEKSLKEEKEFLALKMILHFLHKNQKKVFVLADEPAGLEKLLGYLEEDYAGLQVMESATIEEQRASDDMLLNLINGAEADFILSALPSPVEEEFICGHKALINAKVWFGIGNLLDELKSEKSGARKVKDFILRQILKKEIAKKGENA